MKKNILTLIFSILLLTACKEELKIYDPGVGFIQMESTSVVNLTEADSDGVYISIIYGGETNDEGINVVFDVTSEDPTRYEVTPNNGIVEIPAGQFSTEIFIKPIENILVDGDLEVLVSLNSSSSKPIGIAGEGINSVSKVINIIDNDCPIIFEDMVGVYNGKDNWYSSVGGPLSTKITNTYDGTTFQITGLGFAWLANPAYWGEEVISEGAITVEIDPITGVFDIPYTYTATTLYNGAPYDYYVKGSGKYYSCSDAFEIEYELFYPGNDPVSAYFGVPGFIWKENLTR